MRIFAIESSCDETAAAILEAEEATDGHKLRLLSNVVATQIPIHALYGGVVPEIASRAHAESISGVVRQAFADAAFRARYRRDQADALVVAQCVRRDVELSAHFCDGHGSHLPLSLV